ncbi:YdbH domain-containing protein [Oceanobacter sp. 5_MG-2023]|uniref:YdbH domain-containing protein n=1 Tax=Oceanobacter sp. 5_MG-2023 TaxID=3062645 RepID=UPI0026E1D229|nr:YdbH domain-containing protein [Oceanobacter sp. 5_MG-2023]MDO6680940.1 YdbH domain-containing protein [Oceanobacter sp. 5_MG-2023]
MSAQHPTGWRTLGAWLCRGLAAVGLLVICLLILVLVSLPALVKSAANQWLPGLVQQVTSIEVSWHIKTLQLDRLELDYLSARLTDGTTLALQDARLQYDSIGLLGGQLEQLQIHELNIVLGSTSTQLATAHADSTEAAARAQLESEWIELPELSQLLTTLPINDIAIDTLRIEHPQLHARLSAHLNSQRWQLLGQLTPFPAEASASTSSAAPWNLNLQLLADGQILAQISDQSTLLAHWFVQLQQDDTTTQANVRQVLVLPELSRQAYRLPHDLRQLFSSHPVLSALETLESTATLSVNNRFRFPQDLQVESTTLLTMRPGQHQLSRELPDTTIEALTDTGHRLGQWQFSLQHQQDTWHSQLSGPAIRLRQPGQSVHISPWQATMQCDRLLTDCQAKTQPGIHFQWQDQDQTRIDSQITVPMQLQWHSLSTASHPMLSAQIQLAATGTLNSTGLTSAWDLTSHLQLTLNPTGPITLQLDNTRINAQPQPIEQWQLSDLQLRQSEHLLATWDTENSTAPFAALTELAFDLSPLTARQEDRVIRTGASQLGCMLDLAKPRCQLRLLLRPSQWQQWPLPDARLTANLRYHVATTRLTANPELRLGNGELQLRSQLQHQLDSGIGSWQFQLLDSSIVWSQLGLNSMPNLTGVEILSGELSGQGWVDWDLEQQRIQPDIMLRGDNISLVYDNRITLDRWQFLMAMRSDADQHYQINSQISGSTLNTGVELSELLARADITLPQDFSWATANVHELHTRLLGGRIYIPAVQYDSRKEINSFGIAIEQLQLGSLARLEPSAELDADGLLDGALPIVLTPQGPSIPAGNLFARAPGGTIRYQTDASEALKQSDPSVALAMQLLENFHFKELKSGVRYQPDGALNLSLQFEGNNPDFFDGQATHLNVNLEYNLLDLLSSLRVADDVINRLEQKYQ